MLPILAGLQARKALVALFAVRACLRGAAARCLRAYADYQVRRAIDRLQRLDDGTLDVARLGLAVSRQASLVALGGRR